MQKKQKRFFLGLIILIILIVLFTYYSELKTKNSNSDNLPLSPGSKNSRIQEDDSTNSKNLFEINPELTIEFVGPERLATLHISPKSAIDQQNSKPTTTPQINANVVSPSIVQPKPLDSCTTPKFLDGNINASIYQTRPDIKGRYVVWEEMDNSSYDPKIKGYDLGQDKKFNTTDDGGLITLYNRQSGIYMDTHSPRVNDQGKVIFNAISFNGAYLLTCTFSNCQNTIQVLDIMVPSSGQIFFLSRFLHQDISNNTAISVKDDYNTTKSSLIKYDLTTGLSTTLMAINVGRYPNIDLITSAHIDNNGIITAAKITGPFTAPINQDAYFFLANNNSPIPIRSIAFNSLSQDWSRAYQFGTEIVTLFENPDALISSWTHYPLDIWYRIYQNSLSNPVAIYKDNGIDERATRATFNSKTQKFVIAFISKQLPPSPVTIKTMSYNAQTKTFTDYKSIPLPSGYTNYYFGELDDFNVVSETTNRINSTTNNLYRIIISEC
ncbi:hypothetical protein J4416_02580 [Candidatus Pacearchaeota archaeon]|nr:hypothetical protein [Candidatus Pacearchaeota archaeon]